MFSNAHAASYTWTGTTNTNWNLASNWGGAGYPIAGDNATIPNTANKPTVNVTSACTNITFSGTSTLTLAASLTVSGSLTVNNGTTPTISVGSGFTLAIGGGSNIGGFSATSITFSGSGTTTISGASNYSQFANLIVSSGTLTFNAGATLSMNNNCVVTNSGTMNFSGTSVSGCSFTPGFNGSISNSGTISGTYLTLNESNNNVPFTNSGTVNFSNSIFNQSQSSSFSNTGSTTFNTCTLGMANNNTAFTSTSGTFTATSSTFTMSGGPANITNSGTSVMTATGCTFNLSTSGSTTNIANSATFSGTGCTFNLSGQTTNITNSGSGTFSLSGSTVSLTNNLAYVTNTSSGAFTINGGSIVNISAYQAYLKNTGTFYAGTSGSSCTINATFQGTTSGNTSIVNSGTFYLGSTSVINATGTSASNPTKVTNSGTFTLQSDANGSASIGALGIGASVTGNYNVERYVTGGALSRRGYRLLSAPVYQSAMGATNGYGFTDLQARTPVTSFRSPGTYTVAQPSTALDPSTTNNPSVFFYYEPDVDPNTQNILFSDYKGLNAITDNYPVGNGFLFFFRGNRTATNFTISSVPQNTTLNFYGAINQGSINVYIPTNPLTTNAYSGTTKVYANSQATATLSTTFSYTNTSSSSDGFHLVGNPYPCAIDLDAITLTNPYSTINNYIYILNNANTFGVYNKGSGSNTLNNGVGRYILSGGGFFVRGNSSGASLSFSEACKVTTIPATPTTFAIAKPAQLFAATKEALDAIRSSSTIATVPQVLHITLSLDSLNANETIIQFGNGNAKNNFDGQEDAHYMSGPSQTTFMASYTADKQPCLINQMGSLDSIKTIKLYAGGKTTGQYTIQFAGVSSLDPRYKLYLKDNFLKDSVDISLTSTYTFNIDHTDTTTYGASRFSLVAEPSNIADQYSLKDFNGTKNTKGVAIAWRTKYEGDYTGFTVQRSIDGGKTYAALTSLQSDGSGAYYYTDTNPANGNNLYRLVQNNINNVNIVSDVVTVSYLTVDTQTGKLRVFPNPVSSTIQIKLDQDATATLSVKIYSITGNPVTAGKFAPGSTLSVDVSKLTKGNYIIEVTDSRGTFYGSATFAKL